MGDRFWNDPCIPDEGAADGLLLQCNLTTAWEAYYKKTYAFNGPLVEASDRMGEWAKALSFFNTHKPAASACRCSAASSRLSVTSCGSSGPGCPLP